MISRLNYTGRAKLPHKWVAVTVHDGEPRTFDAQLNLAEAEFPPDAAVYVEATSSGSPAVMRFEFGSVGGLSPPPDRRLSEVAGEHVIFSVKIVDRGQHLGRILGLAAGIRPAVDGPATAHDRQPILPVN